MQEAAIEPAPRVRRRPWLRWIAWIVALVVVVSAGVVVGVVANRDHWLDRDRQITMHQLNIVGHPDGFRTAKARATDPGPAGWDVADRLGRRYYDGRLVPGQMTTELNFWLGRGGVLSADGPDDAQLCELVDVRGYRFGCGNFYRETPEWRVWIAVSGDTWPAGRAPAGDKPTNVHLQVVVQPKRTLAQSWTPIPSVTSPGLTGALGAGRARTVLSLSSAQAKAVDLDGATFGPDGELVTAGVGQPAVVPAITGQPAQRLAFTSWPSVERQFGPATTDGRTTDLARIDAHGSLWVHHQGIGLRRIDPDGHVDNVMGIFDGDGSATEGPAIGQDPIAPGQPMAVSPDGTAWVAAGHLLRMRNGKLHAMNLSIQGVRTVATDGHDGVYFSDGTRLFQQPQNGLVRQLPGSFTDLSSIAAARDGSLFLLDAGRLLRMVGRAPARTIAGDGTSVASRDDPVFCAKPVTSSAATLPVSAAYDVIVSPYGGVYLTGCNRLVQVGY